MAGFTSFVCRFVKPVHRWRSAGCNGEYDAVALIFFGASFGADRSLGSEFKVCRTILN